MREAKSGQTVRLIWCEIVAVCTTYNVSNIWSSVDTKILYAKHVVCVCVICAVRFSYRLLDWHAVNGTPNYIGCGRINKICLASKLFKHAPQPPSIPSTSSFAIHSDGRTLCVEYCNHYELIIYLNFFLLLCIPTFQHNFISHVKCKKAPIIIFSRQFDIKLREMSNALRRTADS